jgi:O-methyltransferase
MKNLIYRIGKRLVKISGKEQILPVEFTQKEKEIFDYVINEKLTMTSPQDIVTTILCAKHAALNDMKGDFVECGVWRGGNVVAAKLIFDEMNYKNEIYLYDTFTGMTEPSDKDINLKTDESMEDLYYIDKKEDHHDWCFSSIEEVKNNITKAGIGLDSVKFIKGDVLETLKDENNLPQNISILRLDTDWYDSTKIELEVLYPRLISNGFLIVDDYGHWEGQKRAVDEYFKNIKKPFMNIIDPPSSRILIKT